MCVFIDKGILFYKVLNSGVPIIVAHSGFVKNNNFLMRDFIFSEYI